VSDPPRPAPGLDALWCWPAPGAARPDDPPPEAPPTRLRALARPLLPALAVTAACVGLTLAVPHPAQGAPGHPGGPAGVPGWLCHLP
jgi:hypothetical protein